VRHGRVWVRAGFLLGVVATVLVAALVATAGANPQRHATAANGGASARAVGGRFSLPDTIDPRGRVGSLWLGASKNSVLAQWGVPDRISRSGSYVQLSYGHSLMVNTDARRIVEFEVAGHLAAGRGVRIDSSLARWRRAYPGLRRGSTAATWLLDQPGGNLTALQVKNGRVTAVLMQWRGGSVRENGGGRVLGRGSGGLNPFRVGKPGYPNCSPDGKTGWCWCTWWAYHKRPDVYDNSAGHNGVPIGGWDAARWPQYAHQGGGYPIGVHPVVGSLVVFPATPSNSAGHIAYVESVNPDESFTISEYNRNNDGRGPTERLIAAWQISAEHLQFIYGGPATGGEYIGQIVQWDGDTKAQKTSWLVVNQAGHPRREWIPTVDIYWCLKGQGAGGPDALPGSYLSTWLPDSGLQAGCSGAGGSPTPTPAPTPTPTPPTPPTPTSTTPQPPTTTTTTTTPPPPPPTWRETTGGVAHTWTNYTNAGGTQGPSIASNQTVDIACKVTGFRVADGNTWWYRIASAPWSGQFYVSADAFYNNGQTSGSLVGTPFVDPAVANC
jgi:surface antigen